jgi:hypothetical protein
MKSAYELAMERLAQAEPAAQPLRPEQKARLAEIDTLYQGKIAEREIFLRQKLEAATAAGEADAVDQLRRQLADERTRLEEERDEAKERVRQGRD